MTKSQELLKQLHSDLGGGERAKQLLREYTEAVIEEWEKDHKRPKEVTNIVFFDIETSTTRNETVIDKFTAKLFEEAKP